MGNVCNSKKLNSGFILVTALLFLLILTLLAVGILQNSLISIKITSNYQAQTFAFQTAENNLKQAELELENGTISNGVTEISNAMCGVKFYRIIASGEYHGAKSKLQSTYAIIGNTDKCNPKPTITQGRHSWRIAD
jgi:type IV pilus assembly protein PilX